MTQNQKNKIIKLYKNQRILRALLIKIKRDLNYLVNKVQSSVDKTLIHSRINMIKELLNSLGEKEK